MADTKSPQKAFITYAHKNTSQKKDLEESLGVMVDNDEIEIWSDAKILPGDKWEKEIKTNLEKSDILLYLTSAASLASRNCNKELTCILDKIPNIRTIPIVLERCDFLEHSLSEYQALPIKDGDIKPISKWNPHSDGWQEVTIGIRKKIRSKSKQPPGIYLSSTSQAPSPASLLPTQPTAEFLSDRAGFFLLMEDQDAAINAYTESLKVAPDEETYNDRGVAYERKGEYDNAINDFNMAIVLKSNYANAYHNRGVAYKKKGEYDKAVADYDKAIELNPNFAEAYTNRGNAYRGKANFDKAISDQSEAIKINPEHVVAYINRGGIYTDRGEYDNAIADCNKAIELNPTFAEAYHNRGLAYAGNKEYDKAIADYNEALAIDQNLADAYKNRGDAYCGNKEYGNAIEDFNKAIELKEYYAQAYNNRAVAKRELQDYKGSRQDFQTAINLAEQQGDKVTAKLAQKLIAKIPTDND